MIGMQQLSIEAGIMISFWIDYGCNYIVRIDSYLLVNQIADQHRGVPGRHKPEEPGSCRLPCNCFLL